MSAKQMIDTLPQFEVRTLDAAEIAQVSGGMYSENSVIGDGCTCGTVSVCHMDGTTDSD